MIYKAVFIVAFLIVGNATVSYIRDGYEMGEVVLPTRSLSETSLRLGSWKGTELPSDPRIREILCAKDGIDRVYKNDRGQDVLVHAVWTDDYLRLHFPQQCYRESGWELTDSKDLEIERSDGSLFPCKILSFAQGKRRIQVLYWFQLGDDVFLDRLQHRVLRRKVCWGQKEWPPLMKFMLETKDSGLARGEEALQDMAAKLMAEVSSES